MFIRHTLITGFIIMSSLAAAACWDPTSPKSSSRDLSENRKECLKKAHFVLQPTSPSDIHSVEFREKLINPPSKIREGVANDSTVYCRYVFQHQNGTSAKFRCALTNEQNQFLDSKGRAIPEAVDLSTENGDVFVVDRNGQKIWKVEENGSSKAIKATILKVRYAKGDARNVENYTSAAASRILWALGIPTHANIMTDQVICFGCSQDPFSKQTKPLMGSSGAFAVQSFQDASIEVKFPGDRIYDPTQDAWSWSVVNSMHPKSSEEQKLEIEILALATQLLAYAGDTTMQNAIVCKKFSKENPAFCENIVAMVHDIGGALGVREKVGGNTAPRGDLKAFASSLIFQPGTCTFKYSDGKKLPLNVSRRAQLAFLERARALTRENLGVIFKASHFGNLNNPNHRVPPAELESMWVRAVESKIQQIQSAPCP